MTFTLMMTRIIKIDRKKGTKRGKRKYILYVLNKQAVRLIEKDSTEVKNDPLSLNIWRNLNILRDMLEGGHCFHHISLFPVVIN